MISHLIEDKLIHFLKNILFVLFIILSIFTIIYVILESPLVFISK